MQPNSEKFDLSVEGLTNEDFQPQYISPLHNVNEAEEQLYEDEDPTMQGLLNEDW